MEQKEEKRYWDKYTRLSIQIRRDLMPVLMDICERERRYPREQAALLLEQALESAVKKAE